MKQMTGNIRRSPRLWSALAAVALSLGISGLCAAAGESPNYLPPAETRADLAHDGQLPWAVGASSYQVVRSVASNPSATDGSNASFRHHHFLAWWGDRFWVYHLAAVHNDEATMRNRLNWSADGITWANADSVDIFPSYMGVHQRAAFYIAANNVLLVTTWYSEVPRPDGKDPRGLEGSRLVRRINGPGDFGPIHVLKHNWKGPATFPGSPPPLYTSSSDTEFKTACDELLNNKLYRQQFQDEDQDPAFYVVNGTLGSPMARAFNWYTRNNGEIVGLWKYADTVATTWDFGQVPAPQDYTSRLKLCTNSKIWGCKTADGRFALFGNPYLTRQVGDYVYQVRYPLAVSASADGITFDTPYATVEGDMDPMRYPESPFDSKAPGHAYVRGIEEGFPRPADGNEWLVTSQNKEDIWVTRVPVPIKTRVTGSVNDGFQSVTPGGAVPQWNIRSEQWATVKVAQEGDNRFLRLTDKAEVGYAKAFRVFESVDAAGGNNFGWSGTANVLGGTNAGEVGGTLARSSSYRYFADTNIGTLNRPNTLRLVGSLRLADQDFNGGFSLGYFKTDDAPNNFLGIVIAEPSVSGQPFRGKLSVRGAGGTMTESATAVNLSQNTTLSFDLTWTGTPNGSGTLSGTLAGSSVSLTVAAGSGAFNACGLLNGGNTVIGGDANQNTGGCYFDNLSYTTASGLVQETFDTAGSTAQAGWTGSGNIGGGTVANLSFRLRPHQANSGRIEVDVMDRKGQRPVRLVFDETGAVRANSGETMSQVGSYSPNQWVNVAVQVNVEADTYNLQVAGASVATNRPLAASLGSVERLEFRTGTYRLNDFTRRIYYLPTTTIAGADTIVTEAVFDVDDVVISGNDSTYPVSYEANGATSGTAPANQTKTHDVALTLTSNSGNLAKTGFTFNGWNTAADGSGTSYAQGESYNVNAAVTLYARWAAVPPAGSGVVTETFDTSATAAAHGWTGSGNTANSNNFGWSNTGNVLGTGGEAGGIFARSAAYRYYADTTIETFDRTRTLRLAGSFRLANSNYNGNIWLGFFNPGDLLTNFVGIQISEPGGVSTDPFRGRVGVFTSPRVWPNIFGTNGGGSGEINLPQNTTLTFDLTWTGTVNGSGTLTGTLAGTDIETISVVAGSGTFTAFGLLGGGNTDDSSMITAGCYFDSLSYTKGVSTSTYMVTYDANGATSGTAPASQTKTQDVALALATNSGNLANTGFIFSGWNTAADGSGTNFATGGSYTGNANLSLYAKWIAAETYAVTYDANGATSGTAPASQTKTQDVALALATNSGNLAKTGFLFAGWNTAADGTGTSYAQGGTYTNNAALTLYAKWVDPNHSFEADKGAASGGSTSTTPTGWTFAGTTEGQGTQWGLTDRPAAPDGVCYAYLWKPQNGANLSQNLGATVIEGDTYTVSGSMLATGAGFWGGDNTPIGLSMSLVNAANHSEVFATTGVVTNYFVQDTDPPNPYWWSGAAFAPYSASFTATGAQAGKTLAVVLTKVDGGLGQAQFDNIAVTATSSPTNDFAAWQAANSTAGGLNDDHDNDGVDNGVEWFLGGNANTTGFTALPAVTNTGGTLSVTWVRHPDYPGFPGTYGTDFRVETSATLANPWTPATVGGGPGFVEITGNNVKFTFPAGVKNFARLVVTGP